jgi:hypothetical protein
LFRKFVVVAVCLFLSMGGGFAETKKDKKDSKKKVAASKSDKDTAKDAGKPNAPEKLSFPVPVGHDSKGLKLPSFEDGKLKMLFNIAVANRVDENNVNMSDMQVETYKEDGSPDLDINLPVASFNLATKVISTKQEVKITTTEWELTGNTMEFNTETREGRLGGGVKMIIYNLADETGEAETPAADGAQPPAKPATPPKVSFPSTDNKPTIKVTKPKPAPAPEPKPRE